MVCRYFLGILTAVWAFAVSGIAMAADEDAYALFRRHNPGSDIRIDYSFWSDILSATVLYTGPSQRFSPRNRTIVSGSRLRMHNPNPSWLEGNRVMYHDLSDEEIEVIAEYKAELEALPDRIGYAELDRNEQLAYWLNLYTVAVYLEVARDYPEVRLKGLYEGGGDSGLWHKKIVTVTGVPLSLSEIRDEILTPIWQDPLVLYGLFHGAVGGPNIRTRAYSGDRVWQDLSANAVEFINSLRGVQRYNGRLRASRLYEWGKALFPGGDRQLIEHLREYADAKTTGVISGADEIETDYFDWYIADLVNGRPDWIPISATFSSSYTSGSLEPSALNAPHVQNFLSKLEQRYQIYGPPKGRVTVEELSRGESKSDAKRTPAEEDPPEEDEGQARDNP